MTGLTHPRISLQTKPLLLDKIFSAVETLSFYPCWNIYFYEPMNRLQTFKQVPVMTKAVRGAV